MTGSHAQCLLDLKGCFCLVLNFLRIVPICPSKGAGVLKQTVRPGLFTHAVAPAASCISGRRCGYGWLACFALASFLLFANPANSWGQLNARTATVTLVATLESLSVEATPREGLEFSTNSMQRARLFPLTITTAWAVPSNLTTVKVTHNGIDLFAQKAGETNRVARRIDNIDVLVTSEKTDGQVDALQGNEVRILVQAL